MKSLTIAEVQNPFPTPIAGQISVKLSELGRVTIFCYENEVPPFVEAELERIYGNFFSTLMNFRESGRLKDANTYVVFEREKIATIFLYCCDKGEARVLNEVIKISQDELNRFSSYIFSTYGAIDIISFHAVDAAITPSHRPYQRVNCLEDIVLTLPGKSDDYFNSLGKSTRKTIKGYTNKLKRDFPSFSNKTYEKEEASEHDIRAIIEFNRTRLLTTGKISAFDEEAVKRIIKFVNRYGMMCVATIDGKICAGSISYRVGENYFMHVSAHDPQYDRYRLGVVYRYLTICECIRRGGKECHFLWGRQEFKFNLLGVQRDLHDLVVYRSRIQYLRQSGMVIQTMLKGLRRQAILSVHAWKDRVGDMSNLTVRFLNRLGMLRRSA